MKAAVFHGLKDLRVEEVPEPHAGPGEVVIRVESATTCGTDVKRYLRGHVLTKNRTDAYVYGHECSGVAVEIGAGVTKFKLGDRIATHNSAPCGKCYFCKDGQSSMCADIVWMGGAWAQYARIPAPIVAQNAFVMPDNMPFSAGSMLEPFSCAVYGIDMIGIRMADTVVINGAGPIGLMKVRLAALRGAHVIVCDMSPQRLEVARELGAAETVQVTPELDQIAAVRGLTPNGRGVDVAIEAVGLPEVWEKTIQMARKGGKVLLFGGCKPGTTFTVSTELMHYSQLTLKGVFHTTPLHVQMAFDMLVRGVITPEVFVTGHYPLDKVVDAIEAHYRQEGIKNALDPWAN